MSKAIRCLTKDATVMAMAIDSTDIVARAEQIHQTSAVVTAALGRMLTAASMMGIMLKGRDDSVTLKVSADGPAGTITTVADSEGFVRGYAEHPVVEISLKPNGKLDVSGAVGTNGMPCAIQAEKSRISAAPRWCRGRSPRMSPVTMRSASRPPRYVRWGCWSILI